MKYIFRVEIEVKDSCPPISAEEIGEYLYHNLALSESETLRVAREEPSQEVWTGERLLWGGKSIEEEGDTANGCL